MLRSSGSRRAHLDSNCEGTAIEDYCKKLPDMALISKGAFKIWAECRPQNSSCNAAALLIADLVYPLQSPLAEPRHMLYQRARFHDTFRRDLSGRQFLKASLIVARAPFLPPRLCSTGAASWTSEKPAEESPVGPARSSKEASSGMSRVADKRNTFARRTPTLCRRHLPLAFFCREQKLDADT